MEKHVINYYFIIAIVLVVIFWARWYILELNEFSSADIVLNFDDGHELFLKLEDKNTSEAQKIKIVEQNHEHDNTDAKYVRRKPATHSLLPFP